MKLLANFFVIGILLVSSHSYACRCEWQGPFSWVSEEADLIVLARFGDAGRGNSRDILIEDTLRGRSFDDVVRLWGKYKDYCRVNVDTFPAGTRWVLALDKIESLPADGFDPETPSLSYGRLGDYTMSQCGAYWLREKNGTVTGNITTMIPWDWEPLMDPVPYDVIKRFVNGEADYVDIIEHSGEITSKEAMLRRSKEALGLPQ